MPRTGDDAKIDKSHPHPDHERAYDHRLYRVARKPKNRTSDSSKQEKDWHPDHQPNPTPRIFEGFGSIRDRIRCAKQSRIDKRFPINPWHGHRR